MSNAVKIRESAANRNPAHFFQNTVARSIQAMNRSLYASFGALARDALCSSTPLCSEAPHARQKRVHAPNHASVAHCSGRFAELSSNLSTALEEVNFGATVDLNLLAGLWTANNDARSYSLVSNPAVRLMVVHDSQPAHRPVLEAISAAPTSESPRPQSPAPPAPT